MSRAEGVSKRRRKLLASIHIGRKVLGLDEVVYREMLFSVTGKRSCREMSEEELERVLEEMERVGFKPRRRHDDLLGRSPEMASPGQLRLIEFLWGQVSRSPDLERSLRQFLRGMVGVANLRWLTAEQASRVIEALKAMRRRR